MARGSIVREIEDSHGGADRFFPSLGAGGDTECAGGVLYSFLIPEAQANGAPLSSALLRFLFVDDGGIRFDAFSLESR